MGYCSSYCVTPVVTVTDTDWVQGGQLRAPESLGNKKTKFLEIFLFCFKAVL